MEARRLALLAVALGACAATRGGQAPDLSERETSHGGLIVVHYPSEFLKFFVGDNIHLAGPKGALQWSDVRFSVERRPASEDLKALAVKEVFCPDTSASPVIERSQTAASCFGGLPGLERSCLRPAKPDPNAANPHNVFDWDCLFVKNHHLFRFGYTVPTALRTEVEPLLRSVLAATEAN
jgi:hypothetical protein